MNVGCVVNRVAPPNPPAKTSRPVKNVTSAVVPTSDDPWTTATVMLSKIPTLDRIGAKLLMKQKITNMMCTFFPNLLLINCRYVTAPGAFIRN